MPQYAEQLAADSASAGAAVHRLDRRRARGQLPQGTRTARRPAACWRPSENSKPRCWCWVRRPTASSARWWSARPPTGCCTRRRCRWRSARAATADRRPRGLTRITARIPAPRSRCTWWNASRRLASDSSVPMRVVTFAVRGRTMYPPEVGLHAEDSMLEHWASQAREALAKLRSDGIVGDDVDAAGRHRQRLGSGAGRRRLAGRRTAGHRHVAGRARSRGCSSARAARRSCGTAPFRCWCCPAS